VHKSNLPLLLTAGVIWALPLVIVGTVHYRRGRQHEIFPLVLLGCGTYVGFYSSVVRQHWLVVVAVGMIFAAWVVKYGSGRRASEEPAPEGEP
jgi:hypothetical protein